MYEKPEMVILELEMADVVTLSNGGDTDSNGLLNQGNGF